MGVSAAGGGVTAEGGGDSVSGAASLVDSVGTLSYGENKPVRLQYQLQLWLRQFWTSVQGYLTSFSARLLSFLQTVWWAFEGRGTEQGIILWQKDPHIKGTYSSMSAPKQVCCCTCSCRGSESPCTRRWRPQGPFPRVWTAVTSYWEQRPVLATRGPPVNSTWSPHLEDRQWVNTGWS